MKNKTFYCIKITKNVDSMNRKRKEKLKGKRKKKEARERQETRNI